MVRESEGGYLTGKIEQRGLDFGQMIMKLAVSLAILALSLGLGNYAYAQTATVTTLTSVPDHIVAPGTFVQLQASVTQNGAPVTTGSVTFCPVGTYKLAPGPFPCNQVAYGSAQLTKAGTASVRASFTLGTNQRWLPSIEEPNLFREVYLPN